MSGIQAELRNNEPAWAINTKRQTNLACQRETEAITLRSSDARGLDIPQRDVHQSKVAPAATYFPVTMSWLREAAHSLDGELGRAMFARLRPGGQVYRHVDAGEYYACRRRYHLVLESPEGSLMICGEERLLMLEGEFWEFDNKKPHQAFNRSHVPRVHLIFDLLIRNA